MGNPSLSLRFAVFLSFSITASSSSQFFSKPQPPSTPSPSPPPTKAIPQAKPSDLLSVLGPTTQSSKVNPLISQQLKTCLKFIVPFTPPYPKPHSLRFHSRRRLKPQRIIEFSSLREENELIWWPPEPVLELARLAFDSGGDPDAIHRALDPTVLPVPDVEGCKRDKCELTRTPYGRRFISEELNSYIKFLFEVIAARGSSVGLNVSLNRYDFFHGHLFIAAETRQIGILFHAREYPAYDKDTFPCNMGYCQIGSTIAYDDSMNLRNILWLAPFPSNSSKAWESPGVLVVLDARPGGIIYRDLIPDYIKFARTIYEDDLGDIAVDVNYLNVGESVQNFQLFIC